jgi:hypothetical protein
MHEGKSPLLLAIVQLDTACITMGQLSLSLQNRVSVSLDSVLFVRRVETCLACSEMRARRVKEDLC